MATLTVVLYTTAGEAALPCSCVCALLQGGLGDSEAYHLGSL